MTDEVLKKFQKDLNSGAIALVVMWLIQEQDQPMYGYEIAKRLLAGQDGRELPMNQGALYPVLRSLERQKLLGSQLVPSDAGPPRRYYRLTALGRRVLPVWKSTWATTKAFVDSILEHKHEPSALRSSAGVSSSTGTGT